MARGQKAEIGDKNINQNGYESIKTDEGWKGSHVVLMEEHLGRPLGPGEYVAFKNGHKPPVTLDMIELRKRGDKKSKKARIAEIEDRIQQLQAELDILRSEDGLT